MTELYLSSHQDRKRVSQTKQIPRWSERVQILILSFEVRFVSLSPPDREQQVAQPVARGRVAHFSGLFQFSRRVGGVRLVYRWLRSIDGELFCTTLRPIRRRPDHPAVFLPNTMSSKT